jgi:pimeloyl-[acyl-carrier protein] methyl ester esterase
MTLATRPRLLFAHGWALDAGLWDAVIAALGEDGADAVVFDAGYYGRPRPWPALPADRPLLGVGQSLGGLELLAAPPAPLAGLVAIDGFARFSHAGDFPRGIPGRVLQRMGDWLRDDVKVLLDFLGRAGGQIPAGVPDTGRLVAGLGRLEGLDGRPAARALPVWRLHAEGDAVATLAMADASFAGCDVVERRVRPAADHLSPQHDPRGCADLIRAAMKALAFRAGPASKDLT